MPLLSIELRAAFGLMLGGACLLGTAVGAALGSGMPFISLAPVGLFGATTS